MTDHVRTKRFFFEALGPVVNKNRRPDTTVRLRGKKDENGDRQQGEPVQHYRRHLLSNNKYNRVATFQNRPTKEQ